MKNRRLKDPAAVDVSVSAWTLLQQAAYRLTVPGGLLLMVVVMLSQFDLFSSPGVIRLVGYCPYVVFMAGLILSAVFRRGRLFFAFLTLTLATAILLWVIPELGTHEARRVLRDVTALLVPLNLLALAFLGERGIVSPTGRRRLIFAVAQIAGLALLCLPSITHLIASLDADFVHGLTNWSRIPQSALLGFLVSAIVVAVSLVRRYRPVESSLLWSIMAVFLALQGKNTEKSVALYFATAGLALMIAVVETSYAMAYRDELTQLPSRRALNEALLQLDHSYAVAMVDVDHFKNFNDTYGHEAGDHALRKVASHLARVGGGGKAYRYGGEEFAVLFPAKSAVEAHISVEKMRRSIAESSFVVRSGDRRKDRKVGRNGERETSVTVSIGLAECVGDSVPSQDVLKLADRALYRAKARGRNCTVAARRRSRAAARVPVMAS